MNEEHQYKTIEEKCTGKKYEETKMLKMMEYPKQDNGFFGWMNRRVSISNAELLLVVTTLLWFSSKQLWFILEQAKPYEGVIVALAVILLLTLRKRG